MMNQHSDYYDSSSDESDCENLALGIRKQLVSKLTKNNGSSTIVSSNSVSDISITPKNVLDKQKCSDNTLSFGYNDGLLRYYYLHQYLGKL